MTTYSIIAAMARNRVIGNNGKIPWNIPEDMEYFKKMTMGKPIIMGRKTHESIGRPLPERVNIVLTHNRNFKADGCIVVHSLEDVKDFLDAKNIKPEASTEAMIIGGEQIYKTFLDADLIDQIYLTQINRDYKGDTFFPKFSEGKYFCYSRSPSFQIIRFPQRPISVQYSFCLYKKKVISEK